MKKMNRVCAVLVILFLFVQIFPMYVFALGDSMRNFEGIHTISPFSSYDMGRAGSIQVNQRNQELIIRREDISLSGCSLPVEIVYHYSSYASGKNKWHFQYNMHLKRTVDGNIELTRDDGTKAVYQKCNALVEGKEKWIVAEEFGLFDYILSTVNSLDFSEYTLYSIQNDIYSFDANGRLAKIRNKTCNESIRVEYNEDGQISKIVDGAGRSYKLYYGIQGLVRELRIMDIDNELIRAETTEGLLVDYIVKYDYDSQGHLCHIIYPDGERVEYGYTLDDLTTVKNVDDKTVIIEYNKSAVHKVYQLAKGKNKLLLEINPTDEGIVLNDQYNTAVTKSFTDLEPKIREEAGQNYLQSIKKSDIQYAFEKACAVKKGAGLTDIIIRQDSETPELTALKSSEIQYSCMSEIDLLSSMTDAFDKTINLKYDAAGNIVKMSSAHSESALPIQNAYIYNHDVLQKILRNDIVYDFLYDEWGNSAGFQIQGEPFVSYSYKDGKSMLCEKEKYGNGQQVFYFYDSLNRLTGVSVDDSESLKFEYIYNDSNITMINHDKGIIKKYSADGIQLIDETNRQILMDATLNGEALQIRINDMESSLNISCGTDLNEENIETLYNYQNGDLRATISAINGYFDLVKNTNIMFSNGECMKTAIQYDDKQNSVAKLFKTFKTQYRSENYIEENTWEYTYDGNGRITDIVYNGNPYTHYAYDEVGQLIQTEDNVLNQITKYQYDIGGNVLHREYTSLKGTIISETDYAYDTSWKDKLTAYNGKDIIYDEIGNPLSYDGRNFIWGSGRNLQSYEDDRYIVQYDYDELNYRQTKTIYDKSTKQPMYRYRYFWGAGFIIAYTVTDFTGEQPKTDVITYQYDDSMNVYAFVVNNQDVYIYEKNALGDIVGIYHDGRKIEEYHYDEYGTVYTLKSNADVDKYNLLYYRGYVYDNESELYYLQSRYYVPAWGRFLNADMFADTGTGLMGTNMFLYCNNDPMNKIDPTGYWGKDIHKKLTVDSLKDSVPASLTLSSIANANALTDTVYSPLITISPACQGRHFNRQICVSEAEGDDTRGYYGGQHMANAVQAYKEKNFSVANRELGYCLHCVQDVSAHGNIGVDNPNYASHTADMNVDKPEYDWKDDNDRGRSSVLFCVYKTNKSYGKRYEEAKNLTGWSLIIFLTYINK